MKQLLSLVSSTIKGSKEQFAHYGETIIDMAIDNEAWENIPLVDNATKILNIKDVYKKNKLKRNYAEFLKAIQEMNQVEIDRYLNYIMADDLLSEDTAETIFEIITDAEKPLKANLLGNLSVALSKDKINLKEYNTLILMIQNASIPALKSVPEFIKNNELKLHKNGMGTIEQEALIISLGVATRSGSMFRLDKRGQKLVEYGFKLKIHT